MKLKQFLRYQVSGTIFLLWLVVFHYGKDAASLECLFLEIANHISIIQSLAGVLYALPIGVLIHQISVNIKNWVVAVPFKEFDDCPDLGLFENQDDTCKYCREKISNLNSFYYVRMDNGLLAPLFAWLITNSFATDQTYQIWWWVAIIIGIALLSYIPRLRKEINIYNEVLRSFEHKSAMLSKQTNSSQQKD